VETIVYLLIFIAAFIGIVVWVFGRKRKARFEKDARIPFDDKTGLEFDRFMSLSARSLAPGCNRSVAIHPIFEQVIGSNLQQTGGVRPYVRENR